MGFVKKDNEQMVTVIANLDDCTTTIITTERTEKVDSLIVVDPKEFGLEADKAKEVESAFTPVIVERDLLAKQYADIVNKRISPELTTEARELRLKLVKVRTNTDRIHKTTKAFYLAGGRFVDAWRNKNVTVIEQMEDKLGEIEQHYELIEKQRLDEQEDERIGKLAEVTDNPMIYPLRDMEDDAFDNLYEGLKMVKEKQIEIAAQAEAERILAEQKAIEEQKRIREENERLKMEAIENDRKIMAERAEAERLAKIEREKQERAIQAERAKAMKERDAQEAKLAEERKAKAEAEAKLAEIEKQKEAERKAKLAAERKAMRAPDKTKLETLIGNICSIQFPACADDDIQDAIDYAKAGISEITQYLDTIMAAID